MPAKKRTGSCSECGKALYNVQAKVCSPACRQRRGRRTKRQQEITSERQAEAAALPPELAALKLDDELRAVAREELRPVVREAITAEVLAAAGKLVGLTPLMVACIEADMMQTADPVLRQRAYTLLARHTLGNTSIAPTPQAPDQQPMQVVFQLPRPGQDFPTEPALAALELRECVECQISKPAAEMVGASDRCLQCQAVLDNRVKARFGQQ